MTIDFHFQSANIVKYRTDVTFGWLDLMVSFGGIAGLFLGCSILSGVEIFYYFLVITFRSIKQLKNHVGGLVDKHSSRVGGGTTNDEQHRFSKNVEIIKIRSFNDADDIKDSNKKRY